MAKKPVQNASNARGYWAEQIADGLKQYHRFQEAGDRVVDRYRIEKAGEIAQSQDNFNILYSSTETMRPSLYATTPKIEATARHRDRKNPLVAQAVQVLESCVSYAIDETDFDEVMNNCVEDYVLPGMGQAWVRYEASFKNGQDANGKPLTDADGNPQELVAGEAVAVDYVPWKDFLTGRARVWKEVPWGARRVYMYKADVTKRFGADVANSIEYKNLKDKGANSPVVEDKQAEIWEIWHKPSRTVVWYSEGYPELLDTKPDPLKLKGFFPFPKPLRAISNTKTIIPRPFYSQYQTQAEQLDVLTRKIRHLTQALQVRGVYDASATEIQKLLQGEGNKLIPIENWAQFIGQGGVNGALQWVPIKDIVAVLVELYNARERAKSEIYEVTGFSDIVRGASKASETLGAQEIKQDWASARLKQMQKEVQRFARDIIRIMAEVVSEHFTIESFALYSGFEAPPPAPPAPMVPGQPPAPDPQQQALEAFKASVTLLKKERERCAQIGIETDSTLLPDEAAERKDRMDFLGAAGAFMQQAGPIMQTSPEMRAPLLAMMMFTIRTFRAARPLEKTFEEFQEKILSAPPQDPNGQKGGNDQLRAQTAIQVAQIKTNADLQKHGNEMAMRQQESAAQMQADTAKAQAEVRKAEIDLQIKQTELEIKRAELELKVRQAEANVQQQQQDMQLRADDQAHQQQMDVRQQDHSEAVDVDNAGREDQRMEQEQQNQDLTNDNS
jgi:hypothetical protein